MVEKEQNINKNPETLLKPILKPPKELLDYIQYGVDPMGARAHVPGEYWLEIKLPTSIDGGGYVHIIMGIFGSLEEFYRLTFDKERKLDAQLIGQTFAEALVNSAEHGNKSDKNKNIVLGCWYGKNGVLFGLRDEGDFFCKKSTKELIESRIVLPSTRKKSPGGLGLDMIYKAADKIHVSTEQNALFVAISTERFIIKK